MSEQVQNAKLEAYISPGFDYARYCGLIKQNQELTPEEKAFAIEILNPTQNLSILRGNLTGYKANHLSEQERSDQLNLMCARTEAVLFVPSTDSDREFQAMVQEMWDKTKQHYHTQIVAYDKKYGLHYGDYPHCNLTIRIVDATLSHAAASFSREGNWHPTLTISTGFLKEDDKQKKEAMIAHECYHLMEHVLAGKKPESYSTFKETIINSLTFNGRIRKTEREADALATNLADGNSLIRFIFQHAEKFERLSIRDEAYTRYRYTLAPVIGHTAHHCGFSIDRDKFYSTTDETHEVIAELDRDIGMHMGSSVPSGPYHLPRNAFYFLSRAQEFLFAAANRLGIDTDEHPSDEERIANIHEQMRIQTGGRPLLLDVD